MALSAEWTHIAPLMDEIPAETVRSGKALLIVMRGLGPNPSNFRLLRGLTPWLDTQRVDQVLLLSERMRKEPWRPGQEPVAYFELVHWDPRLGLYRGVVWQGEPLEMEDLTKAFQIEPAGLVDYVARRYGAAVVSNGEPVRLKIRYIEKPWGREGWYSGIEARGVSQVVSATGQSDLPYALGLFPETLMGRAGDTPILIKTLEPLPDPEVGDLYLEVHQEKWESYIVLSVDKAIWPDGVGVLRAGLDTKAIGRFRRTHGEKWDKPLMNELRQAIGGYEEIRRQIDALVDQELERMAGEPLFHENGQGKEAAPPPSRHQIALRVATEPLLLAERQAREVVYGFLGQVAIQEGDVLTLPVGVLHSLQHGVKVLEFQTPTYERLIAMFTQKVLTQDHWDTEAALGLMAKSPFQVHPPSLLLEEDGFRLERVVDFPQFQVDRLTLGPSQRRLDQPSEGMAYQMLVVASGQGQLRLPDGKSMALEREEALLLPAQMGTYELVAGEENPLVVLVASPK